MVTNIRSGGNDEKRSYTIIQILIGNNVSFLFSSKNI